MMNQPLNDLIKKAGCRYMLVTAVAQRARQLQANPDYADIPVIFLTADEREEVKNKGLALGAKGFMGKPLVAEEMLAGIAAVLG